MKIVTARRICQILFFALFLWLCIVSTVGRQLWQIGDYPVNFFFYLDPLVALGTMLAAHALYGLLVLSLITVILTIIFGRFFCSWVCPFGSVHHFFGFLAKRRKKVAERIKLNQYHKAQRIKYYILVVFLVMAAFPSLAATLQIGLLDPISFVTRSFNIMLLPIFDRITNIASSEPRFYQGAWLILAAFAAAVLLNFIIPRFYCRFICPLGAFFGLIDRFAIWRIGKKNAECLECRLCEENCEGACQPTHDFRISECVLCFNCLNDCRHHVMTYQTAKSASGEITDPDISRRGFILSLAGGALALPAVRLANQLGSNYNPGIIRPPGALSEEEFLKRCIKCGQCMRVCPTNVIQPASTRGGLENLWTPTLNNRIGSSGCQYNCVACGQVCPTAAIRPISLDEKHGSGDFADAGPVKIGTAFVDRSRCLPWVFGRPCIVCQENCPVSPKAIYTKLSYDTVRNGEQATVKIVGNTVEIPVIMKPAQYSTGDYYCTVGPARFEITDNSENTLTIKTTENAEQLLPPDGKIKIEVRLQRPYVDPQKCIGCGVCEHECPVSGKRAIRVSAEGETRSANRKLLLD
ncbi:MAG: 4Fe-4S binding protein [Phycisphaerae bacterium]|jgi:polyferredoxin/ferredoxin